MDKGMYDVYKLIKHDNGMCYCKCEKCNYEFFIQIGDLILKERKQAREEGAKAEKENVIKIIEKMVEERGGMSMRIDADNILEELKKQEDLE